MWSIIRVHCSDKTPCIYIVLELLLSAVFLSAESSEPGNTEWHLSDFLYVLYNLLTFFRMYWSPRFPQRDMTDFLLVLRRRLWWSRSYYSNTWPCNSDEDIGNIRGQARSCQLLGFIPYCMNQQLLQKPKVSTTNGKKLQSSTPKSHFINESLIPYTTL